MHRDDDLYQRCAACNHPHAHHDSTRCVGEFGQHPCPCKEFVGAEHPRRAVGDAPTGAPDAEESAPLVVDGQQEDGEEQQRHDGEVKL